jgi:lipopolysaccharide biosynthesis protein
MMKNNIKPIAIYLPQYHTFKENDEWWGKGFTEWTNVKKATPLFDGHYQPHIPLNQNYYDLSIGGVLEEQAELAKKYGIYGFCFYHYWFNGKLLMEKPLHNLLESKTPDFPYCLCWANENWTRTWDGQEKKVLMKQEYSLDDDLEHIKYLIPFFKDSRYIKIGNKPVFLMYRTEMHPNIKVASELWREEAKKAGFEDLFLIRVENFEKNLQPTEHGFDAGMEFAPDNMYRGKKVAKNNMVSYLFNKMIHKLGIKKQAQYQNGIFSYKTMVENMMQKPKFDYQYFRTVTPSWDNSARRKENAAIYIDSTPLLFEKWVKKMKEHTLANQTEDQQFLFINAWNEWGEGCHLEPDEKWQHSYLEAFQRAINSEK